MYQKKIEIIKDSRNTYNKKEKKIKVKVRKEREKWDKRKVFSEKEQRSLTMKSAHK